MRTAAAGLFGLKAVIFKDLHQNLAGQIVVVHHEHLAPGKVALAPLGRLGLLAGLGQLVGVGHAQR